MKRISIFLIAAIIFLPACGSTKWVRTPVAENPDFKITLEERQVKGQIVDQAYQHPCNIDLSDLNKLLGSLTYIEEVGLMGKEEKMPVFQAAEIERLAPALADTLATAADSQRIRFTSYNRGKGLIFSVSRKTEGVVFMDPDNRLNIAFNYINAEIRMDETTAFPEDFSRTDPLDIPVADTRLLKAAPYLEPGRDADGETAPLWMAADLEKLKQASPVGAAPNAGPKPETRPAALPETQTPAPAPDITTDITPNITLQQEIRNKLIYLKELLDDGLITKQDYNAKKDALLEKIK
jgi:hypothetical protein